MKKGFTLIELLAVIVILAIILLIAIPIVQKTIQDAKYSSNKASIDLYGRAANQAIERYQIKNGNSPKAFHDIEKYIEYSGNEVVCSTKVLNGDMTVYLADCKVDEDDVKEYTYGELNLEYVYIWYDGVDVDGPYLNDIIDPSDYSISVPDDIDYYLKFKFNDTNEVTEGYACAVLNDETYCLKGWNPNYYGYSTNTRNVAVLKDLENKGYDCYFDDDYSECSSDSIYFYADSDGYVSAYTDDIGCDIEGDGPSYCIVY